MLPSYRGTEQGHLHSVGPTILQPEDRNAHGWASQTRRVKRGRAAGREKECRRLCGSLNFKFKENVSTSLRRTLYWEGTGFFGRFIHRIGLSSIPSLMGTFWLNKDQDRRNNIEQPPEKAVPTRKRVLEYIHTSMRSRLTGSLDHESRKRK